MKEITITLDEYKEMLELSIKAKAFAQYAKTQNVVTREECAAFFGFEVTKDEQS